MNLLRKRALEDNKETAGNWEPFAAHRARVTELLHAPLDRSPLRLCVLGAGNCNDLDLPALLKTYQEIHVVDLDGEALSRGVSRQGLGDSSAVKLHAGIDVTGALETMAWWSPGTTIADADLDRCLTAPFASVQPMLAGPFEVVVSTCLLSQLLRGVVLAVGESHPQFLQAIQAVRAGHVRLLAGLVARGGCGLLISDLVSSDSYPPLGAVRLVSLSAVLARLIQDQNFFHGLNPAVLAALFQTDPLLAPEIARVEPVQPWLWDLGSRIYGVYALRFFKRP